MAIKQTKFFKGMARTPVGHPHKAGHTTTHLFTHVFSEAVATTDILELIPLAPGLRVVECTINTENIAATNLTVGLMSGNIGSLDAARTSGNELVAAQVSGTEYSSTLLQLAALAKNGDTAKSLGLKVSADVAAAANKKLHVKLVVAS